jgi:hypothetical protein
MSQALLQLVLCRRISRRVETKIQSARTYDVHVLVESQEGLKQALQQLLLAGAEVLERRISRRVETQAL